MPGAIGLHAEAGVESTVRRWSSPRGTTTPTARLPATTTKTAPHSWRAKCCRRHRSGTRSRVLFWSPRRTSARRPVDARQRAAAVSGLRGGGPDDYAHVPHEERARHNLIEEIAALRD